MSLTNAKKLLDSLSKSVCLTPNGAVSGPDFNRQWALQQTFNQEIAGSNFALLVDGANNIVAYPEPTVLADLRVAAPIMFANAVEIAVVPAAANGWLGVLRGKRAPAKNGANAEVVAENFWIRGRPNATYTVTAGETFAYGFDAAGNRIALLNPDGGGNGSTTIIVNDGTNDIEVPAVSNGFYVKCQANWKLNRTVSVKLLDGYGGSELGNAFYAVLRGDSTAGRKHYDPNCVKGQTLRAVLDGSTVVIDDPGAWDLPIGTIVATWKDPVAGDYKREYDDSGVNISGWGAGDGTGNSTANGGSGIDWTAYYMYAKTVSRPTPGNVSGSDKVAAGTHTHSVPGGTTSTTVVVIDDHPSHTHMIGCSCTTADVPNGGSSYLGMINFVDQHSPSGVTYTGIQLADHTGHGSLTLSHTVTAHDHTFGSGTSGSGHSDPNRFRCYWVERLDNSQDTLYP